MGIATDHHRVSPKAEEHERQGGREQRAHHDDADARPAGR